MGPLFDQQEPLYYLKHHLVTRQLHHDKKTKLKNNVSERENRKKKNNRYGNDKEGKATRHMHKFKNLELSLKKL